jgi:hypothetical protein
VVERAGGGDEVKIGRVDAGDGGVEVAEASGEAVGFKVSEDGRAGERKKAKLYIGRGRLDCGARHRGTSSVRGSGAAPVEVEERAVGVLAD